MSNKSIQSVSPNFVIPAGTQVVLLEPIKINDSNDQFKKPGNVGVVIKCPPHNDLPYLIRFNDGAELNATFQQLVLRRQEIDMALAVPPSNLDGSTEGFQPDVIYRCQVGSKAFGLSNEDSDDDIRGVFVPSARQHWSLYAVPEQIEDQTDENDEVLWELEKFLRLALKANPNILEVLWTPIVLQTTPLGDRLRGLREAFLSKHLYKTYSGYVLSQFRRMKNRFEKDGQFKKKHAMHLLRLLFSGIHALRTGEIMIDVSEHRDFLFTIRNGELSFEQIREHALRLDRQFQVEFETTTLPDQPDFQAVDQFLIEARSSMVQK